MQQIYLLLEQNGLKMKQKNQFSGDHKLRSNECHAPATYDGYKGGVKAKSVLPVI